MEGILNTSLFLFHLHLGGCTYINNGNAPNELSQPLLEFFTVIVRGGFLDLGADLFDPTFKVSLFSGPVDDGSVILVHHNPLCPAQIL